MPKAERVVRPPSGASPAVRQPQPVFTTAPPPELLELDAAVPPVPAPLELLEVAPDELEELEEVDTHWLFEHVWPVLHVPHVIMPPQPSIAVPQTSPDGQVVAGLQPHWLAVPPPPHVWGELQFPPQVRVPPQPSDMVPQLAPDGHAVRAVQTTVTVVMASAPSASRTKTSVVPPTGPAVKTPVASLMSEQTCGFAVLQVVSLPVYHRSGETPPVAVKLMIAPGATVGAVGWIANERAPNVSGTAAEVEGRWAASPP
jgi:hypothetical protein